MDCFYKEISMSRATRILNFLAKDRLLYEDYAVIVFSHWHGHKNSLKELCKTFQPHLKILMYQKERIPWKLMWAYFLIGDRFCLHLHQANVLLQLYEALWRNFLSASFYVIHRSDVERFLSAVMPDFQEKDADDFLDMQEIPYLIYRVDTDAPVASGLTEELCYGQHTPSDWLAYFR